MARATQNYKYLVATNAKMENVWPSLKGIKCGQCRQVSLYANDLKTKAKHEDIMQLANTDHAEDPV